LIIRGREKTTTKNIKKYIKNTLLLQSKIVFLTWFCIPSEKGDFFSNGIGGKWKTPRR